jgi:acyl carrier protein
METMDQLLGKNGLRSQETVDRIRRVFLESLHLNLSEEDLRYEDKLDEAVGLDSVAVLEFVAALEKEFEITFESEMLTLDLIRDLQRLAICVDERVRSIHHPKAGHAF